MENPFEKLNSTLVDLHESIYDINIKLEKISLVSTID